MNARMLLVVASTVLFAACQSAHTGRPVRDRGDSRTVTATDLSTATQTNLLAYIRAERPRWLESRSPRNLGGRALDIFVFVDDQRLGGIDQLRNISLSGVRQIRFYDASEAQQRFNVRDAGGVINVITK